MDASASTVLVAGQGTRSGHRDPKRESALTADRGRHNALVMGIKLRLVCGHFLELGAATPRIRHLMYAFCYGMPALVVLTTAFGPAIERLTAALI